ncbi:hypothetical protein [Methylorubrum extorquens]
MSVVDLPPVWSLLTRHSLDALLERADSSMPAAISIAPEFDRASLSGVPLLGTARLLIERAQALGGLTLTATGALSRIDTRAIFDAMSWPGYDKAQVLTMHKVLNEADAMPVELTRLTAQTANLLRKREKRLLVTKAGQAFAREDQATELFQLLFATVLWRINLGYFDRVPTEAWPQNHIGIVLWCLSVAAQGWLSREDLVRTCTVWDPALDEGPADFAGYAFESRVLRPLTWLGLFEVRRVGDETAVPWRLERQYRKTQLFDQTVRFDVELARPIGPAH